MNNRHLAALLKEWKLLENVMELDSTDPQDAAMRNHTHIGDGVFRTPGGRQYKPAWHPLNKKPLTKAGIYYQPTVKKAAPVNISEAQLKEYKELIEKALSKRKKKN